ncbi:hypothetical protein Ciccas_011002 [Cichlidogyrus casuarinus]|uniref:Uncharacterized protein n=1 Tax=Cichlidogyrus casuarinus TaxID=1844966 RepID=A0ABD2PX68_9PLAT
MLRPIGQLEAFVQNLAPAGANVSSALLSPLATAGSTMLTQMSANTKANLMNYGLATAATSDIPQNLIKPLEMTESALEFGTEQVQSTGREEPDWLNNRKRDSSAFTEEDIEMKEGNDECSSSPNTIDPEPKPSPRKIVRLNNEEDEEPVQEEVHETEPEEQQAVELEEPLPISEENDEPQNTVD